VLRWRYGKFKANLGYIVKLSLNTTTKRISRAGR
jgi:hypothetical protein